MPITTAYIHMCERVCIFVHHSVREEDNMIPRNLTPRQASLGAQLVTITQSHLSKPGLSQILQKADPVMKCYMTTESRGVYSREQAWQKREGERKRENEVALIKSKWEEKREKNPYIAVPDEHQQAISSSHSYCFTHHRRYCTLFISQQSVAQSTFSCRMRNVNTLKRLCVFVRG